MCGWTAFGRLRTTTMTAFYRWYGPWTPLTPAGVADLLRGVAVTLVDRRRLGDRRLHAAGRGTTRTSTSGFFTRGPAGDPRPPRHRTLCVWSNASGTLRPLSERRRPAPGLPPAVGPARRRQPVAGRPRDDATRRRDMDLAARRGDPPADRRGGLHGPGRDRYLRPEIVLRFKARRVQRSDEADFEAVVPLLDAGRRDWLRSAIERVDPEHAWLVRLGSFEGLDP